MEQKNIQVEVQGKNVLPTPIKNLRELTTEVTQAGADATEAKALAEVNTEIVADKDYDTAKFSGMGRVNLQKNIVDGHNYLTQEMVSKANTIYKIQYDYEIAPVTTGYIAQLNQGVVEVEGHTFNYKVIAVNAGDIITKESGIGNTTAILYQTSDNVWHNPHTPVLTVEEGWTIAIADVVGGSTAVNYNVTTSSITIPENCVLEFEGGSISGGILILAEGINIVAPDYKIFYNIYFKGHCRDLFFHIDWFVGTYSNSLSDDNSDSTSEIQAMFNSGIKKVWLTNNHYYRITSSIVVDASIIIDGERQRGGYDSNNVCKYIYGSFDAPFFIIKATGTVSGVTIRNIYLYRKEIAGSLTIDNEYKRDISTLYFDCSDGNIWGLYFDGILECARTQCTYYTANNTPIVASYGGHRAIELYAANGHWITYAYLHGYISWFYEGLKISKDTNSSTWISGIHLLFDSRTVIGGICDCSVFLSGEHQTSKCLPANNYAYFDIAGDCNVIGTYIWDTSFTAAINDTSLYTTYYSIKANRIFNADYQHDILSGQQKQIKNNLKFKLNGNAVLSANLIPPIFFGIPVGGSADGGIRNIVFKVFSNNSDYNSYIEGDSTLGTDITSDNTYGFYDLFYPDKLYYDNVAGLPQAYNFARKTYVKNVAVKIIMFECTTCFLERVSAVVFQYSSLIDKITIKTPNKTWDFVGSAYFNPVYCEIENKSANDLLRITIEYKTAQTNVDIPYIGICGPGIGGGSVGSWGGSVAGPLHVLNLKSGNPNTGIKVLSAPSIEKFIKVYTATLTPFLHIKVTNVTKPLKVVINNGGSLISLYTGYVGNIDYYPVYVYGNLLVNQEIKVVFLSTNIVFYTNYALDLTIESIECGADFSIIDDLDSIDTTNWNEKNIKIKEVTNRAGLITKRPALADIYAGFMYLVTQPWEDATLGTDGPAGPYYFDGSNSWILADGTTKQDGQMPTRS